jgi:methylated-DNA-[protein]-cysteine S-methyltransferase
MRLFNQPERLMKLIVPRRPIFYLHSKAYKARGRHMIRIASDQKDGVWFTVAVNEKDGLVACAFSDSSKREAERSVKRTIPKSQIENGTVDPGIFQEIFQLYSGKGKGEFKSLDLSNVSQFRRKVYALLRRIPAGKVSTYGTLAKKLGGMRYARAVGTAVATNPLSLVIPCHRVVPASLNVGNYGMPGRKPSEGGPVKRGLLEREGVLFRGEKVSTQSLWKPE